MHLDLPPPPRHLRRPGADGYRTPTIEDTEEGLSKALSNGDSSNVMLQTPGSRLREVHSSALESTHSPLVRRAQNEVEIPIARSISETTAGKLNWKKRIRHFTWAFFTLTMATGGIANVIYNIPYRFRGLDTIGIIFFLANIVFYLVIWAILLTRFYLFPYTFKASFLHPTESLFVPASVVSFGTILINISQYGTDNTWPWLTDAVHVLFWVDSALAVISSAGVYLLLWSTQTFTIAQMTPIWIFPAYPMLIIGPHAGLLSAKLEPSRAVAIIIGGTTIQGVGFLVSLMVYSAFIYRLMSQKLPKENIRPGMFVSVGPSAFTVASIVTMAAQANRCFPDNFMGDGALAAFVLKVFANFASLWLWGLAIFFFFIASFAHLSTIGPGRMVFTMAWFSFVFPNTALITSTFAIGNAFSCRPILILGCAMVIPLLLIYGFVVYMMVRAIYFRHILWPQKGEDKDEGGFEIKEIRPLAVGEDTGEDTPV
ncbi:putative C4-dicarboxylate transporter/malic acid transport protein [Aspergillus undulatus]|uniref:putative C4-dicarboxylate transporter/malic acid transport protein n=1 Tax=Aspergillus undulatus TaxID=1810928 RepID=UPI003CCD5212